MPVEAPTQPAQPAQKSTYGQILKSTALIGGSSVINLGIGIFRAKAMALILGPSGVGLNGLYGSVTSLAETLAGMGINSSGVRQIAEAVGSGDEGRVLKTAAVLRRASLVLGLIGALALAIFSKPISIATFGDDSETWAICLLAAGLFFKTVSAGQGALLQGTRRIADVARIGVFSAFFGTIATVALVYLLRDRGVAISLAAVAAITLTISYWYSRSLYAAAPTLTAREVRTEATGLLKLGTAFLVSSLVTMGSGYVIRAAVFQTLGPDASGLYQSAWALGILYTSFVLQAMGSDFYPRLTAVAGNDAECNRLVNEQARVSLLLAGTGIVATLTFAPLILQIFYSSEFSAAVGMLRWICLGTALQVISWPMGFILVARNAQAMFVGSDMAWAAMHIGLAWVCMRAFGLDGAGIAFFGAYLFHVGVNWVLASRLSGFRWSRENQRAGLIYLAFIAVAFGGWFVLPYAWALGLGIVSVLLSGVYSLRALTKLVAPGSLPRPARKLLGKLGMLPAEI